MCKLKFGVILPVLKCAVRSAPMVALVCCVLLWFAVSACRKKKEGQSGMACSGTPSFSADVKRVFDASCALSGCHDALTRAGGYDLSSYTGVSAGVCNGLVLCSMRHEAGCSPMPKGSSKLSDQQIALVDCWRVAGCPNN